MRISRVLTGVTAIAASVTLAGIAAADNGSDPELVTVSDNGGELWGEFVDGQVSDDGKRAMFVQPPDDADVPAIVHVRDRDAGTTTRLHEATGGGWRTNALSGDGGSVAIGETADGGQALQVIDVDSGDTTTVGTFDDLSGASLSDDGGTIAFTATQDGQQAVYVADVGGEPTRVSGYGGGDPVLSGDGDRVAYSLSDHVYAKSLPGGDAERVDVRPDGEFSEGDNPKPAALSDSGGFLLFTMSADDLASGTEACVDTDTGCAFRRNFAEDKTTTASVLPDGTVTTAFSADLSGDGTVTAFSAGDADSAIYQRVLSSAETQRIDVGADGEPANGSSSDPSLTQHGTQTLFANTAANWGSEDPFYAHLWITTG